MIPSAHGLECTMIMKTNVLATMYTVLPALAFPQETADEHLPGSRHCVGCCWVVPDKTVGSFLAQGCGLAGGS